MRICFVSLPPMWEMTTVWEPDEAPPAIISIFLGEQLEDVIDQLCDTGEATHSKKGGNSAHRRKYPAGSGQGCHRPEPHLTLCFYR